MDLTTQLMGRSGVGCHTPADIRLQCDFCSGSSSKGLVRVQLGTMPAVWHVVHGDQGPTCKQTHKGL